MATRDEIVDQIAGFALFADLTTPQLERIAHMFEEEVFPEGARVLRQGLSGSAFYIILDGEAAVVIDGQRPVRNDTASASASANASGSPSYSAMSGCPVRSA